MVPCYHGSTFWKAVMSSSSQEHHTQPVCCGLMGSQQLCHVLSHVVQITSPVVCCSEWWKCAAGSRTFSLPCYFPPSCRSSVVHCSSNSTTTAAPCLMSMHFSTVLKTWCLAVHPECWDSTRLRLRPVLKRKCTLNSAILTLHSVDLEKKRAFHSR